MNVNQQRNSNPILCYSLIFLGALCIIFTVVAAIFLKDGIVERASKPKPLTNMVLAMQVDSIERQIQSKDRQIEFEKSMPDTEKKLREAEEKLNAVSGKKNASNSNSSNFEQKKARNIKKLEDEKAQLIAEKDELTGKMRANRERKRTWRELYVDYNVSLLISAVLPLGVFSLIFTRLIFSSKMPERNPLSLTDFEKRCVLFLPFALIISAFGFFLFVWILAVTS
jgi:hypothetical protein